MCKLVRRLLCLAMTAFILFAGITVWGKGGGKFRQLGEKTGGIVQEVSSTLAEKADELAGAVEGKFKRWSGRDDAEKEESIKERQPEEKKAKPEGKKGTSKEKIGAPHKKKKEMKKGNGGAAISEAPEERSVESALKEKWDKAVEKVKEFKNN